MKERSTEYIDLKAHYVHEYLWAYRQIEKDSC